MRALCMKSRVNEPGPYAAHIFPDSGFVSCTHDAKGEIKSKNVLDIITVIDCTVNLGRVTRSFIFAGGNECVHGLHVVYHGHDTTRDKE